MTQASEFLATQTTDEAINQLNDVDAYLDAVELHCHCVGESTKNGNEVMTFTDGSVIVRIESEAFDYDTEEDYR